MELFEAAVNTDTPLTWYGREKPTCSLRSSVIVCPEMTMSKRPARTPSMKLWKLEGMNCTFSTPSRDASSRATSTS